MNDLRHAHRAVHEHLRALRDLHAFSSNNEVLLLSLLWAQGPGGPSELAHALGVTGGGLTTVIRRLEAAGIVERAPHGSDRRRLLVGLTPRGHALVAGAVG